MLCLTFSERNSNLAAAHTMSTYIAIKRNLPKVPGICMDASRTGPRRGPGSPYSVRLWLSRGYLFGDSGLHTSAQTDDEVPTPAPEFPTIKMPWGVSQGTSRPSIHAGSGQHDGSHPCERGQLFDGFEVERLRRLCGRSKGIGRRLTMGLDRSCPEDIANIWRMTCLY